MLEVVAWACDVSKDDLQRLSKEQPIEGGSERGRGTRIYVLLDRGM